MRDERRDELFDKRGINGFDPIKRASDMVPTLNLLDASGAVHQYLYKGSGLFQDQRTPYPLPPSGTVAGAVDADRLVLASPGKIFTPCSK